MTSRRGFMAAIAAAVTGRQAAASAGIQLLRPVPLRVTKIDPVNKTVTVNGHVTDLVSVYYQRRSLELLQQRFKFKEMWDGRIGVLPPVRSAGVGLAAPDDVPRSGAAEELDWEDDWEYED